MKYDNRLLQTLSDPNIKRPSSKCKVGSELGIVLLKETSFLDVNDHKTLTGERLWYVQNNIHEIVKCPVCNNTSSVDYRKDKIRCCSLKCGQQLVDPETGLTNSEQRAIDQSNTKKRINSSTGISQGQESSIKAANTLRNTIDPETGLTLRELRNNKVKESKKLNPVEAWNKNVPMTEERKLYLSKIRKERFASGEIIHWNQGNSISQEIKDKISQTALEQERHYSQESLEKREKTIQVKKDAGWVHPETKSFIDKLVNSTNPNALSLFNDKDWLYKQHITNKRTIASICVILGLHWKGHSSTFRKQFKKFDIPIHRYTMQSAPQLELERFLAYEGIEFQTNIRTIIGPYEIDIYIPEFSLAIEFNGLYWHSEIHKEVNYHLTKTEMCEELGIRLIHIFEDEWLYSSNKCKETLLHLLGKSEQGDYARNTIIKEIEWKQAKDFLNRYHLLNAGQSGNYRIGAFNVKDELIGVMVFGQQNNEGSDKDSVELRRFVTNKKNNPGLGSKMFKYAIVEQGYKEIIAFVDRRWFTGLVKTYIGFTLDGVTSPALWWTDGSNRYHRRFITKKQLIDEGMDRNLTKVSMMLKLGYVRIWDCGKLKLKWNCV
jgi:hypothetical protein